jgi:hypothetical protein
MRPGAMPVIELDTVQMPTKDWGTRPRPSFKIVNWKSRDIKPPPQISDEGRDYEAEEAEMTKLRDAENVF